MNDRRLHHGAGTEFGLQVSSAASKIFGAVFLFQPNKMKYSFLRTNISLAIIGVVLGLICGFKLANWQYRRVQGAALQTSVAQANSRMPQSRSTNSDSSQKLTPEEREQMVN